MGSMQKKKKLACTAVILMIITGLCQGGCGADSRSPVLRVAMPYSDHVSDPDTNYYINWLEEKTGLNLEITRIRQMRSEEYLKDLFASNSDVDVILFGEDFTLPEEELTQYEESGDIWDGGDFINYGAHLKSGAGQILWINYEWLKKLGLSLPRTTEELQSVLTEFRDGDPNGNGRKDEIPLVGAAADYSYAPAELLFNSFVYNDPWHSRDALFLPSDEAGSTPLPAAMNEFREGLIYCRKLTEEKLLDSRSFSATLSELSELVNSPADLVGAFTTASISDVIYQGNPEVMAKFMHVPPLTGPKGVRHAVYYEREPSIGAVITARSKKKEEAKRLLETMMTEEASLIARFGEEGVDWVLSDGSDVSIYETPSTIVTRNYLWNTSQNKHLNGIGPMNVPEKYLEGVIWNGVNSDAEYIDARAQMSYRADLPESTPHQAGNPERSAFLDERIREFLTGEKEIGSNEEWESFIKELGQY